MTVQYHLRSLAQDDLESIWLYTVQHWGVEQADTYLEALINRFEWLAENAKMVDILPALNDGALRYFLVKKKLKS